MSIQVIKMPDIGEGIAEVEIVEWHVAQGDDVQEDEVLVDVMTDKASVEIPSPVTGRIVRLNGAVGDTLAVGAELLAIDTDTSQPVVSQPDRNQVLASPSVRYRARQLGIDLASLGLPSDAVIAHTDLDHYLLQRQQPSSTRSEHRPVAPERTPEPVHAEDGNADQQIRLSGMRRQIASKMQTAARQIPHFSYVEEVDVTELEALRAQLNSEASEERPHLTLLPFMIRAMVLAIQAYPEVNARFDESQETIHQSAGVHLGVATQTDKGLMVPVLRHVEHLDIWQCAEQVANAAALARRGSATREQLSGSTITLTSLGALGGIVSTPIINHPEVAIVGVNRIVSRWVPGEGSGQTRKMMNLSSSFDHRIIDGMQAAQFIQHIRRSLEHPALLFMDRPA